MTTKKQVLEALKDRVAFYLDYATGEVNASALYDEVMCKLEIEDDSELDDYCYTAAVDEAERYQSLYRKAQDKKENAR